MAFDVSSPGLRSCSLAKTSVSKKKNRVTELNTRGYLSLQRNVQHKVNADTNKEGENLKT